MGCVEQLLTEIAQDVKAIRAALDARVVVSAMGIRATPLGSPELRKLAVNLNRLAYGKPEYTLAECDAMLEEENSKDLELGSGNG